MHAKPVGHFSRATERVAPEGYFEAFDAIDFESVRKDLKELFTNSKEFWPADYGNYGPFMVRLAWHSSGSYRASDGRGGIDGGRMRFDPERSWDDNTNLDKAKTLLTPIKQKYGLGLSWGDLFAIAGEAAITSMGGPSIGFCGGRIDDATGFWSERLGPNADQEENEPCDDPVTCPSPFGANRVGLIYVNPQGPGGNPDPLLSAVQVRSTFARMGMNDYETVALVGGGHAFGKTHGPCPAGAGPSPKEDPFNPWPGNCGSGRSTDTFTSGFDGPWTQYPTQWDNEYFKNLIDYEWEQYTNNAGAIQWRVSSSVTGAARPTAILANNTGSRDIIMLTADLALKYDPAYKIIVEEYAADQSLLDTNFAKAWYKLVTRDMGPVTRCMGKLTAPVQDFQNPLPAAPTTRPDEGLVRAKIVAALTTAQNSVVDIATENGNYGGLLVRLAWRCSATHRVTDYAGGCNGARIRQSPQKDWPVNGGLDKALALLQPVKDEFGENLTWSDLIVLAGTVALEQAGAPAMTFCAGRSDADVAMADPVSDALTYISNEAMVTGNISASVDDLEQYTLLLGLNAREFTALMGMRSIGVIPQNFGYSGQRTLDTTVFNNEYFTNLLSETWIEMNGQYKATGKDLRMLRSDLLLSVVPDYLTAVQDFAADNDAFLQAFTEVWTKIVNADRFDGPTGNVCYSKSTPDSDSDSDDDSSPGSSSTAMPASSDSSDDPTSEKKDASSSDPVINVYAGDKDSKGVSVLVLVLSIALSVAGTGVLCLWDRQRAAKSGSPRSLPYLPRHSMPRIRSPPTPTNGRQRDQSNIEIGNVKGINQI